MKLSELNAEEIGIVADELYIIQMRIKRDINTNYREMSGSKIRALKALRTILKKEAFDTRQKSIEMRQKEKEVDTVNEIFKYVPVVTVINEKIGIKYKLKPELWGTDNSSGKNSIEYKTATIRIDVHLGLNGFETTDKTIIETNDLKRCLEVNDGLMVFRFNKDTLTWESSVPEHHAEFIKSMGYVFEINTVDELNKNEVKNEN